MFYCQKLTGGDFDIKEWNEALKYCEENNIQGDDRTKILHPDQYPCENQCFDCMAIVSSRRRLTNKFLSPLPSPPIK